MAGIIAENGHLVLEVGAPLSISPSAERRASETVPPTLALERLDTPALVSGPIRTPSDWTSCVSNGFVSIAIS
jgi:hypothetical protein